MTLSKLGYATAFVAAVAGLTGAEISTSSAIAQTAERPSLSVGCVPKSEIQARVFNASDQAKVNAGQSVDGKIGVKDQFYSVNRDGPQYPVRTSVAVDYNGKSYGNYAYIIETSADNRASCVTNIIKAENLSGASQIPSLRISGVQLIAEGHDYKNKNEIISILMRGEGGNTFTTQSLNAPIAVTSHTRQVPMSFAQFASLKP